MSKRLTDEQEAEIEAIASARCDKAAKIAATMLREGAFDPETVTAPSARAFWAAEAGTRPPSDKTWACVVRLVEPLRESYKQAEDLILRNLRRTSEAAAGELEDLASLWRATRTPAEVVTMPPDCGLESVCPECEGAKVVQDPGWAEWYAAEADGHEKAVSNGIAFLPSSDAYYAFLGEHPYPTAPEEIPCETCNGLGTVPTEIGEALLAFLRPRFAEAVRA